MAIYDGLELERLVLTGPRLTLRPWDETDTPALLTLDGDPAIRRFTPGVPQPYTEEVARGFIAAAQTARQQGTALENAVVRNDTGEVVASIALRLPSGVRGADIGYLVLPGNRGEGYAAEATDIMARWAFAHRIRRIELFCDVANLASAATALRSGFRFEGFQRGAGFDAEGAARTHGAFARLASDPGEATPWSYPRLSEPLTDGVVALRPFREDDIDANWQVISDPRTIAVGFTGEAPEREQWQARQEQLPLEWLVGGLALFAIEDVETGQFAGSIQLRKVGPPALAAIGYEVHPSFRGRKYTTRALQLLSAWAFSIGYGRLELGAKWHNLASRRAAEAAGFSPEGMKPGRLRNPDGSMADEAYYHLLNPAARRDAAPTSR